MRRFWGDMIHRQNAGPAPIPHRTMTVENLSKALKEVVSPAMKTAAGRMGEQIRREQGEHKGVESFHRHLPLKNMLYVAICLVIDGD
jgi:UDP:flavonoid glycosyltransferase YjiC (YdhE family)